MGIILSVLAAQIDDEPRDITGPEFVPPDPTTAVSWLWLVPVLVIAVALLVSLTVRAMRAKSPRSSAIRRALSQLDRLASLQLLAKHQPERHFTLLAGILRRYLEKAFAISAARQTTTEFHAAAGRNPLLSQHLGFLTSFLNACDIAKFAPPSSIPEMGRDLEADLRAWLLAQSAAKSSHSLDGAAIASKMSDS